MKKNGFVGCFVPEISGVENHPVKKTPKVTVPLLYLCKIESEQREKGSIKASLVFTNHPDNLASISAFTKAFPEAGEKFRWYTALRVEKQLFTENETFHTISTETGDKFNSIVKELITELKGKINL